MARALAERQKRAMGAIAEAIFLGSTGAPDAERIRWLIEDVADLLQRVGGKPRRLIVWMVRLVSVVGPILVGTLPPFRRLPVGRRARALERMEGSRLLSGPVLALKAIFCVVWYEHPDSAREIGYDGACVLSLPPGGDAPLPRAEAGVEEGAP